MKVSFWLLDVNYEVREHKPEMWIWCIDNHGKLYEKAEPYVFASYNEIDIEYYVS